MYPATEKQGNLKEITMNLEASDLRSNLVELLISCVTLARDLHLCKP